MFQAISKSANYKWWVFGTIAIGTFLSVVDHGSVLVALPEIESYFRSDLPTVQWVVVGYALAISVLLLPMGRLGDIVGRKQVYIAGFIIFALAAGVAGAAPNLPVLISAKVLQGMGSAMIQGNGMAAIISVFPGRERGKALGAHLSVVGAGAIAGPALGGLLISAFGWRSVFFFNVPVGVITIVASAFILDKVRSAAETQDGQRSSFDWPGAVLSGLVLLVILLVVGNGDRAGWASPPILVGAVASVALLVAFVWWELRAPSPMLELRLFTRKLVALGVTASWISFLGTAAARFMMPFYLQRVLELSPREVGLMMIPPAVCMVVLGPISGRLSDKFGWQRFTLGGLALSAIASFVLAISLTEVSPVWFIVVMLMFQSAGNGLFNSPNNSSILSAVERYRYGVVSALTQLVRNSANVVSIAMATTVVVVTMGARGVPPSLDAVSPEVAGAFVAGLHRAFFLLGLLLVVGMVITLIRGERPKETPEPAQKARVGESLSD